MLISSVLDMQCEFVNLFVWNRQDACLSGYSGGTKKERDKYKPSNVLQNV